MTNYYKLALEQLKDLNKIQGLFELFESGIVELKVWYNYNYN